MDGLALTEGEPPAARGGQSDWGRGSPAAGRGRGDSLENIYFNKGIRSSEIHEHCVGICYSEVKIKPQHIVSTYCDNCKENPSENEVRSKPYNGGFVGPCDSCNDDVDASAAADDANETFAPRVNGVFDPCDSRDGDVDTSIAADDANETFAPPVNGVFDPCDLDASVEDDDANETFAPSGNTISEQILSLSNSRKLDQNDRDRIEKLYDFVQQVFSPIFPGCAVHCFGSSVNGLGCKESDVDIHLELENQLNPDRSVISKKRKFSIIEDVVRGRKECVEVHSIPHARVPVIKFQHVPTRLHCDLSFKNMMGIFNSRFIKQCVDMDNRFLPLFMTIKYLAKTQGLLGGGGSGERMTSYALTLLLIFYFQQLESPIFPPVADVIDFKDEDLAKNINGWVYAFNLDKVKSTKDNSMDLELLLTGFFEFYSTFYYEFIISPYFGTEVSRDSFKAKQLSGMDFWLENTFPKAAKHFRWCFDETTVYKRGLQVQSPLCVQDPFELNHNVTKNVDYTTLRRFRQLCGEAVNVFTCLHRPLSANLNNSAAKLNKAPSCARALSPRHRRSHVRLQELLQIRVPDGEFDEYSDRHLIPAVNQAADWPPLSSPTSNHNKSSYRLTTPSNQLICYLCGSSSCKYDSFVHLRGHLLEKHRSITRKQFFRPVEVMEVVRTLEGRLSHSLGLLQNIVCMTEFITLSQDELRYEHYLKKQFSQAQQR